MSFLDSILGTVLGNAMGGGSSPLRAILASILSGQGPTGPQGGTSPGLGGLLEQFSRAGHGDVANSWVGNGPNQSISPDALNQVFGQQQVGQWAQQAGMPENELLNQLSQYIPHAVNTMTPDGTVPQAPPSGPGMGAPQGGTGMGAPSTDAFDGPGRA